ncbi:DUF397 domain-containing protein [Streptomyces sp. NPDC058694]
MTPRTWQKSSYCSEGDSCIHIASTLGATPKAFAALIHVLKENPAHV